MELLWHVAPSRRRKKQVVLASVVDGSDFYAIWEKYSLPSWRAYALRNGYALATASKIRLATDLYPGWAKVLLPQAIAATVDTDSVTVVLDADQVFSPLAPPIEKIDESEDFGFVPLSLDGPQTHAFRNLAFLRRTYLDAGYPLDSLVHFAKEHWADGQLVPSRGYQPFGAGFVAVPASRSDVFASLMGHARSAAAKQSGNPGGGDQLVMIRELSALPHYFLDRRWQVIWPEYIAEHRPDLYARAPVSHADAALAVATALFGSWCVHFATSWPEKEYWEVDWQLAWKKFFGAIDSEALVAYRSRSIEPVDYGRLRPPKQRLVER